MLHLRHPCELGGAYWLFNMAYTQVSVFVVLRIGSVKKGAVVSESDLRMIAIMLASLWVVSIVSLLIFSERGFKHTFYRPMRAWEYTKALFDTGIPEYRLFIFDDHREYYRFFESEVKAW